jgi:hypothetical protein
LVRNASRSGNKAGIHRRFLMMRKGETSPFPVQTGSGGCRMKIAARSSRKLPGDVLRLTGECVRRRLLFFIS